MVDAKLLHHEAINIKEELVKNRRHIHTYPELSFDEDKTAEYVAEKLSELKIKPKTRVGKTGVIADIKSGKPGKTVALRVDMDALPITESNDVPYCSKNSGVMHACGHDAHTAMGLGAAYLLSKNPPSAGTVRLVFQPAEEDTNSDGKSGAVLMMEDDAFKDVSGIFAVHVYTEQKAGNIALKSGPLLAACDKFEIKIKGIGSHGAYPELGVDPVILATHVIQAIQTIISRKNSAHEPLVVTIGGIKSNTYRPNIISDFVELTGTVRYFYDTTRNLIRKELEQACKIAVAMGGSYELRHINENPAVTNEGNMTELVNSVAENILGKGHVEEASMQMGGDDFSFLSKAFPACYFFLGAEVPNDRRKFHTETFDIDEECLPLGSAILAASALKYLEEN